jgi:excisionase family DNA binding protein
MDEKILTPDQVAQILQVHPFTVLKFIKQGKLRASRLGRVYRIRQSDVGKFLDEQEAAAAGKSQYASKKQTTHKEAEEQTAISKNQTAIPGVPAGSPGPEDENLLEAEQTLPEPAKENFVHSESNKKEQQGTPNKSSKDKPDHYILD